MAKNHGNILPFACGAVPPGKEERIEDAVYKKDAAGKFVLDAKGAKVLLSGRRVPAERCGGQLLRGPDGVVRCGKCKGEFDSQGVLDERVDFPTLPANAGGSGGSR
jgi:hypothetical protein